MLMDTMSTGDAVNAFLDAMRAAGVVPTEPIANKLADGQFVRFHCDGDRKGKANGWARLFLDGRAAGRFGNHRLEIDERWKADGEARKLTAKERSEIRAKAAADKARRAEELAAQHEAVAAAAVDLISRAALAISAHPYLTRKRVPTEGLFQIGDMLLVPMHDADGRIWNAQRIFGDGAKRFLKGGRIEGLMWLANSDAASCGTRILCIGEGVATMKAVRRATGHDVAVAFSKDNLEAVARILRARWPDRRMVICADDDAHLVHHPRIRRNLGVDAARAAAAAIGASVALPPRSNNHG